MYSTSSYASAHAREIAHKQSKDLPEKHRPLLTDRNAYISFLEQQLEKVQSTVMTVQSFSERLSGVSSSLTLHENRILNLARLLSLSQENAEKQHSDTRMGVTQLSKRLSLIEGQRKEGHQSLLLELKNELGSRLVAPASGS